MAREIDAFDVHAGAPRHFHVEQRQRNRDAGPAIEHLVQEAVARILVVKLVADEAELLVKGNRSAPSRGQNAQGSTRGGHRREPSDAAATRRPLRCRARRADRGTDRRRARGLDPRDHQRGDARSGSGLRVSRAKRCTNGSPSILIRIAQDDDVVSAGHGFRQGSLDQNRTPEGRRSVLAGWYTRTGSRHGRSWAPWPSSRPPQDCWQTD